MTVKIFMKQKVIYFYFFVGKSVKGIICNTSYKINKYEYINIKIVWKVKYRGPILYFYYRP